ncbi:MAG: hypothetical protein HKO66_02680 [Saprospiraceae bacterium]|nr:hypothetical protein [Bacteroidia bacterium]NNE16363.1 hypothetical protein [Saprospiraceae bacterium]NNL91119.1 hypothetical protein [Saprospiraceae bacterium]
MTLPFKKSIYTLLIILVFGACYNFKGIVIPPDLKTYKVEDTTSAVIDVPIDLAQLFSERLRRKIREESRLVNDNTDPDIVYAAEISGFKVTYLAPDENNTTSLNRLEIRFKITYTNNNNEEDNWTKSYNDFEDFDSNTDFQSIQDGLIEEIIEDVVERVFNDSFTNW